MARATYIKQTFSNFKDLENVLKNQYLVQVQKDTLFEMEEKLMEFIEEEVYSKSALAHKTNDENTWRYERTYDLYNIWNISRVYVKGMKVYGTLEPTNYSALTYDKDALQHSSPFKNDLSTNDYVKIINNGLSANHSIFGEIQARPFWDKFVEWANKNYKEIYQRKLKELL